MDLNFHQTFKPEKTYISEIIQNANNINDMTLAEISFLTGIPQGESSGKVLPHIKYAKYMGLINYSCIAGKYDIMLTELGKEILNQDVSLSEDVTMIVLNSNIINKKNGAEVWSYCFNDFYNNYGAQSKYRYFLDEIEKRYGEKVKFGPFVKSYEEFFKQLNLVSIDVDNPNNANSIKFNKLDLKKEILPVIGYVLFKLWDTTYPSEVEITSEQVDNLFFRNCFAWNKQTEFEALENLEEYGFIRINKQLVPYTIIKLKETEAILNLLYSELF